MKQSLEKLEKLLHSLETIIKSGNSFEGQDEFPHKLKRWMDRTSNNIVNNISEDEGVNLIRAGSTEWEAFETDISYRLREANGYRVFLKTLIEDIKENPEDYSPKKDLKLEEQTSLQSEKVKTNKKKEIFIVHGHDTENAFALQRLLKTNLDLDSIILREKPEKGRTVIEKFEQEADGSPFAFVLYTPDDLVEKEEEKYHQARPNVLFELGWFYGRLGRHNVCLLYKRGTKIPSDLKGVIYVEFAETVEDTLAKIQKELKAAGIIK